MEMYSSIIRPLLFSFGPERIHGLTVGMLRAVKHIPGAKFLAGCLFGIRHPALEREVLGMKFPNPVGVAAGFDKNAEIYDMLSALGFGYVEVGAITPKPQGGNPRPRLFRLPKDGAIVNRMGFNNKGMDNAIAHLRKGSRTPIGANIGKNTATPNDTAPADYLKLFRSLYEYVDYFVVNVSCPNVKNIGQLQSKENILSILEPFFDFRRGQNHYRPVLVKISPDLSFEQIDDIIDVLVDTPLDGIVATNTTTSREGLNTPAEQIEKIGAGGLSGRPLKKRALEIVRYVHEKTEGRYPIIGVGGIMNEQDALDMLHAGADLIQIYTGMIYEGPSLVRRICKAIIAESRSGTAE